MERVTKIELALLAWEAADIEGLLQALSCLNGRFAVAADPAVSP